MLSVISGTDSAERESRLRAREGRQRGRLTNVRQVIFGGCGGIGNVTSQVLSFVASIGKSSVDIIGDLIHGIDHDLCIVIED
jgi:hypothetical protein